VSRFGDSLLALVLARPIDVVNRERIGLLLLDYHVLFREGLSRVLASEADFEMMGNCGTSAGALAVLQGSAVDIVLLDFDLGGDHGSQFAAAARRTSYAGRTLVVTAGMDAAAALESSLGATRKL
jgi:DNA-binding NarL/FixJ family response regulator